MKRALAPVFLLCLTAPAFADSLGFQTTTLADPQTHRPLEMAAQWGQIYFYKK